MIAKTLSLCFNRCFTRPMVSGNVAQHSYYRCERPYSDTVANIHNIEEMKARITRTLEEEFKETEKKFDRFQRDFEELSENKYADLIKSEEDRMKIRNILETYEYEKYMTAFVPNTLTLQQMQRLMNESQTKRVKTLKYFYRVEVCKRKDVAKREMLAKKRDEIRKLCGNEKMVGINYDPETNAPLYGLWKNSMFAKISDIRFDKRCCAKLFDSCLFGQPLIFDFGFETEMDEKCLNNMALQMALCLCNNRRADYPFSLWFCNLTRNSKSEEKMLHNIGNLYPNPNLSTSFINVRQESYLDVFPKEKLVYLTPNADKILHQFDSDAIYIVGAFVDRSEQSKKRSSYFKAKQEGLQMAKLPIDQYVYMKGVKTLTMDQMMNILVTVKDTNSWNEAFKHIPSRKIKTAEEVAAEEERRLKKLDYRRSKSIFVSDYVKN